MPADFEKLIQMGVDLLKEPLRPLAQPPRGDAKAKILQIPVQTLAFPPDCPGCGKPAQQPLEVNFEDISFIFVLIALLNRRASPETYRLQVPFCNGCAEAIDRRRKNYIGRVILLILAMVFMQIPRAILFGLSGNHPALFTLVQIASLMAFAAVTALLIWTVVKVIRKPWYFGFRILRVSEDALQVRIDDPDYAARLQALCRTGHSPAAA